MPQQKAAVYQGVEELSEEECLEIASLKTKTSDLTVENVTMTAFSDTPTGFLGDHYKLVIAIQVFNELKKSEELIDLHFFVKTKPRNPTHTEFGENLGAFKRECDFFSTLSALLNQHASDSDKDQRPWTPDCFLANEKSIVLDDLSRQGFRLTDGRRGLDTDHCTVLFQTLARFHASSVIYEETEGRRLGKTLRLNEIHPEMLTECILTDNPRNAGRQLCDAGVNAAVALVKLMLQTSRQPERYKRALQAFGTVFEEGCRLVKASVEHRNVVCHSDLWTNNILFRYDSTGIPNDVRLIDYQLLRYSAPASDLMTALYLNTRRKTREKHFQHLARVYHSTLAEEFAKHRLEVETIVPWMEFKSSLEYYRWLGILMCFVYYPTTSMTDEVAKDVTADPERFKKFMLEDQSDVALRCFENDDNYRERLSEIVEELADYLSNSQK